MHAFRDSNGEVTPVTHALGSKPKAGASNGETAAFERFGNAPQL